jgi:uncharacterized membrane-anchored protein YjiN (DUF445 family)
VTVPSAAQAAAQLEQTIKLKEIEQKLQTVMTPKVATNPRDKELQELLANLTHSEQRDQVIREFLANGIKKIKSDASLSARAKRERITELEESVVNINNRSF